MIDGIGGRGQARALAVAGIAVLALVPAPARAQGLEVLEVQVTGLADDRGRVGCSLHDSAGQFPKGGAAHAWAVPSGGQASCLFRDLRPGRIAVAVFHDRNGNGRLDLTLLGLPAEDWGLSGAGAPRARAPRFQDAAVTIGPGAARLRIDLSGG